MRRSQLRRCGVIPVQKSQSPYRCDIQQTLTRLRGHRRPRVLLHLRKSETHWIFVISSETRRDRPGAATGLAARRYVSLCYTQPPGISSSPGRQANDATCSHDGPCAHADPQRRGSSAKLQPSYSTRMAFFALKRLQRLGINK